jgi:nucleotide-binding universal stress UspA family protein
VIRLRFKEPELERPFRAPLIAPFIGAPLAIGVWVVSMVTHPGARYAGPVWLLAGVVVYLLVRRNAREGVFAGVEPIEELPPGAHIERVLVPMKLGPIGEEMVATAVALAKERDASVDALFVILVPLEQPIDAPMLDKEEQAAASLAEAALLGEENGVRVDPITVRARSIGKAIVDQTRERDADLIVLGSSPRWRRQSTFFSPTVDYVLRNAPCDVLVVAFPQGVLEEDVAATLRS